MSNFQFINLNYNIQKNLDKTIPIELLKFADSIYDKYEVFKIIKNNNKTILKKYFYLNRILIINLFNGYKLNTHIRYGRSYQFYKNNKINKNQLNKYGYKTIIKLIDLYSKNNLIYNNIGYYDKKNCKNNLLSRIFPKQILIQKFKNMNIIDYIQPKYTDNLSDDLIIVREKHKKIRSNVKIPGKCLQTIEELKNSKESINKLKIKVLGIKENIFIINQKILNSEFKILNCYKPEQYYKNLFYNHSIIEVDSYFILSPVLFLIKRIFNNSSLTYGGRLYSQFQLLNKEIRNNLIINNKSLKSLDFSASHIRLLYHLNNKEISNNNDIYGVRFSNDEYFNKMLRKITKKIIFILLNSKNQYYTRKLVYNIIFQQFKKNYEIDDNILKNSEYLSLEFINNWINDTINNFEEVKQYFFTGIGLRLQYIEGELLQYAIYNLIKDYDTLAIPVHDEILVSEDYVDKCIEIINYKYKNIKILNNFSPTINIY